MTGQWTIYWVKLGRGTRLRKFRNCLQMKFNYVPSVSGEADVAIGCGTWDTANVIWFRNRKEANGETSKIQ